MGQSSSKTSTLSEEEGRWLVVGICLTKVLPPDLRKVLNNELQPWYHTLCQPPHDIHKQIYPTYKRTLPSSTFRLNYESINNNKGKREPTRDYAVKDCLSLAKLYMQPHMAKCTGFDQTMDMSAILSVMCNANPFSSATADAKKVRDDVRNKWAHCNFSDWTQAVFTSSINDLISLIKKSNLSPADEKAVCDDLCDWEKKGLGKCFGQPVKELVMELRTSLTLECDTKMKTVEKKLNNLESKLLKRIEEVEKSTAERIQCLTSQVEQLAIKVETEGGNNHDNYAKFAVQKVPYGLRPLPRDLIQRSFEVDEVLGLFMQGKSKVGVVGSHSGDLVGIRGMGGLGKTVLALAVAWEVSHSRQVIWLDIGQNPNCLELINIFIKVLGGGNVSFSNIKAAQAWIKENTSDKDCLLVLDDVWSVNDLAVFDCLSGKCKLLITTRDADVVRGSKGSLFELAFMDRNKSRALLYQSAGLEPDEVSKFSPEMHHIVGELLKQCRGLPLALSIVGSSLIDTRSQQDWQDVLEKLQKADLEKLHSQFPTVTYPYDTILAAIDASFQALKESEREKFLDFGIFPEDINISSDIFELFWSSEEAGRTSCTPEEGRDMLRKLEKKSLIQKGHEHQGKTSYRIHDLLLDFARVKLKAIGTLTNVERVFVKCLRGLCVNGEWITTPNISLKDYYFKYLPYHLRSSEQPSELIQLFLDFPWLEQKVKYADLPSLLSDFRFLDPPLKPEIELLKRSLKLSAHIIEKNPNCIGPELLGRLLSCADKYQGVKKLLESVRKTCVKTCYLLPLSSCLKLEGPEIFKKEFDSKIMSLATCNSSTSIVISGLKDGSIHINELETGKELEVLNGHTDMVMCLAVSHSGTTLASGSDTTILWNMASFEQRHVLSQKAKGTTALDFSTDDERLFTASYKGKLRVWCVATGKLLGTIFAHDKWIRGLCTTKDGVYVATASDDHTIKLWAADTLTIKATLNGHTNRVQSVVATGTRDNPMLVSGSWDETVKIWDAKKHQEIRTLTVNKYSTFVSVDVSPDMKHIISGGNSGVSLWYFNTGELLSPIKGYTRFVSITSDGSKVVCGYDYSYKVLDLDSICTQQDRSGGYSDVVIDIALTQDGSRCVCASSNGSFKIWKCDATQAEEGFTLKGLDGYGLCVVISPDDCYVVSLSVSIRDEGGRTVSSIKVWDLVDGNEIGGVELEKEANIVCFSSDGKLVIIGCISEICIWNWHKNDVKCITSSFGKTIEITCDGNIIYICSEYMEICEIELVSLKVSTVRHGFHRAPMVVLPNGKAVLSTNLRGESLGFYKLSTSGVLLEYETAPSDHPDDSIITAIDITLNGKFALSGSSSGTFSLMNVNERAVVQTPGKTEAGVGIRLICILRDQAHFVFVDETNGVELRDFSNKEVELLDELSLKVTSITTHGVDYVLFGCENGELLLFNFRVKQYKSKHQAHSEAVSQVKSSQARVLSGSTSGCVKLWSVSKTDPPIWSQIWSRDNVYSHPITALAFLLHSKDVVIGSFDNKVHRLNEAGGIVRTYEFDADGIAALRVVRYFIVGAGFNMINSDYYRVAAKWSLNKGLKAYWETKLTIRVGPAINNAFNQVAITDDDGYFTIWNLKTGTRLRRFQSPDFRRGCMALAYVPGSEFVLSSWRSDRTTLKLLDLRNGQIVEEFHFEQWVRVIACASNGMVCVGLQDGQVCFMSFNNLSSHSGQLEE